VGATAKQAKVIEEEERLADAVQFDETDGDNNDDEQNSSNRSPLAEGSSTVDVVRMAKRARASSGKDRENVSRIVEGYAYFKDMARGRLSGDLDGFLKIVARYDGAEKHTIIGVHIMGEVRSTVEHFALLMINTMSCSRRLLTIRCLGF
jgi:hypothetical protein